MSEATTQDLDTEGVTDDVISDVDVDEGTADEPQQTSERPAAKADSKTDSGTKQVEAEPPSKAIDLNKIPKELRPQVEEILKSKDLEWKRTFTRKTQEASARAKAVEGEVASLRNTVAHYQKMAQEVLSDPSKLEAYRKLYGHNNPAPVAPPPKFETVEDILNYAEQRYTSKIEQLEQQLMEKTVKTIEAKEQEVRWEGALNSLRNDTKFKKYENLVTRLAMTDPKYKGIYTGGNEQEVLQAAYQDFQDMLSDDMKSAKQELLNDLKKKKASSTAVPRKTVTTDAARPAENKDDIINRIRQRLGE